jgi:hypothetical protein
MSFPSLHFCLEPFAIRSSIKNDQGETIGFAAVAKTALPLTIKGPTKCTAYSDNVQPNMPNVFSAEAHLVKSASNLGLVPVIIYAMNTIDPDSPSGGVVYHNTNNVGPGSVMLVSAINEMKKAFVNEKNWIAIIVWSDPKKPFTGWIKIQELVNNTHKRSGNNRFKQY